MLWMRNRSDAGWVQCVFQPRSAVPKYFGVNRTADSYTEKKNVDFLKTTDCRHEHNAPRGLTLETHCRKLELQSSQKKTQLLKDEQSNEKTNIIRRKVD